MLLYHREMVGCVICLNVCKLMTKVHNEPPAQGKSGDVTSIVGYFVIYTLYCGIEGVYLLIWIAHPVHEFLFKVFYSRRGEFWR